MEEAQTEPIACRPDVVEIPPIAATPPSSTTAVSSVGVAQGILVRDTERSLTDENGAAATSIDVSQTGRLLASAAGIADAADAAEAGVSIDNEVVIDEAQRFVDSVNALSLSGQLSAAALLDIAAEVPVDAGPTTQDNQATPETEAPGVDVVPLGSDQDAFMLTLDSNVLEAALESNAATTTSQLAALAVPVAETVASELTQSSQATVAPAALAAIATATGSQAGNFPIVPDLTVENAQRREALADAILMDVVSAAAGTANPQVATPEIQPQPARGAQTQISASAPPAVPAAETPAQTGTTASTANVAAANSIFGNAAANTANPELAAAAAVAAQAEAMLPAALIAPPLAQVAQLATNPVVAGTVAAFQVPVDDSSRAGRVGLPSGLTAVKPIEAVTATGAIAPNLANSSNQRRDNSQDANVNQWLATRPGLI